MKIPFRRFTKDGDDLYRELITEKLRIAEEAPNEWLRELELLVSSDEFTENLDGELDLLPLTDRLEFAKTINSSLETLPGFATKSLTSNDSRLWNWISGAYLPFLVRADGSRTLSDHVGSSADGARWILIPNKTRFHRHLVAGPFFAYKNNFPKTAESMVLFAGTVLTSGEVWERIAGKTSLSTGQIVNLATLMFFDTSTGFLRPGAGARDETGVQAFSKFFSQIDLTTDYESMSINELLDILPENLEKWVPDASVELQRRVAK